VGKTALVAHCSRLVRHAFPDGQLFVHLRAHGATAPVPVTEALGGFLRALAVDPAAIPPAGVEQTALLRTLTDGRRMLVGLDDAADAEQVRPLLPGSGGSLVLVTSRSSMSGLVTRDGARRVSLPPMPETEALALLARGIDPARLTAEPGAAAELTRWCGYLPLAVRILADRLSTRPHLRLRELVGQLATGSAGLDVLAVPGDEPSAVRTVFSWSYASLPERTARMFRLCGLHAGPDFGTAAAAALAGADPGQAAAELSVLANIHLMQETGPERFRLHDLLRAYATERATAEEVQPQRSAATLRLVSWFLHTADGAARLLIPQRRTLQLPEPPAGCHPLVPGGYQAALAWFSLERANLVSAVKQAGEAGHHAECWQLAATASSYFMLAKHWVDWQATSEAGLAAARALGDREAEAWMLSVLGAMLGAAGRLAEAVERLEQALAMRRRIGERSGQVATLLNLGVAYWQLGQLDLGVDRLRRALRASRQAGDRYGEAMALNNLAEARLTLGRPDAAERDVGEALVLFRGDRNTFGEGMALDTLGQIHQARGRVEEALSCFEESWAARRLAGDRHGEAVALQHLGGARRAVGDLAGAQEAWWQGLDIYDALNAPGADEVRAVLAGELARPGRRAAAGSHDPVGGPVTVT
ncbi:MAG: tetratricopeptide repeat protein, partial [Streptosporangiaceae bacterium]